MKYKSTWIKMMLAIMLPGMILFSSFRYRTGTDENAVKAMFIYNFTKYFDWSKLDADQEFIIGVYGNSGVTKYLKEISYRKNVNGKNIVIRSVYSANEIQDIQMLFIPEESGRYLETIRKSSGDEMPVLITETKGTIRNGAHINLLNVDGKLRFELNETGLKYDYIKYSKDLLLLAFKSR